jgi:hypothetical protein
MNRMVPNPHGPVSRPLLQIAVAMTAGVLATVTGATPLTPAQLQAQQQALRAQQQALRAQQQAQANAAAKAAAPAPAAQPVVPVKNVPTNQLAAGGGYLTSGTWNMAPSGCSHNGSDVQCAFIIVNRGVAYNLPAGNGFFATLFVDDAHVPHHGSGAYFVDRYNTQQGQMFMNPNDSVAYVITYPNVSPQVATGQFSLGNQVVSGARFVAAVPGSGMSGSQYAQTGQAGGYPQQAGGYAQQAGGYAQQPAWGNQVNNAAMMSGAVANGQPGTAQNTLCNDPTAGQRTQKVCGALNTAAQLQGVMSMFQQSGGQQVTH